MIFGVLIYIKTIGQAVDVKSCKIHDVVSSHMSCDMRHAHTYTHISLSLCMYVCKTFLF